MKLGVSRHAAQTSTPVIEICLDPGAAHKQRRTVNIDAHRRYDASRFNALYQLANQKSKTAVNALSGERSIADGLARQGHAARGRGHLSVPDSRSEPCRGNFRYVPYKPFDFNTIIAKCETKPFCNLRWLVRTSSKQSPAWGYDYPERDLHGRRGIGGGEFTCDWSGRSFCW